MSFLQYGVLVDVFPEITGKENVSLQLSSVLVRFVPTRHIIRQMYLIVYIVYARAHALCARFPQMISIQF